MVMGFRFASVSTTAAAAAAGCFSRGFLCAVSFSPPPLPFSHGPGPGLARRPGPLTTYPRRALGSRGQRRRRPCPPLPALKPQPSNHDADGGDLARAILGGDNGDGDPYSRYTHQIAIPLDDAPELHSALTAIQTSLVQDCPRLVRACIVPALLRMPLLYVDGSSLDLVGSGESVDAILERVVYAAIREVVYGDGEDEGKETAAVGPVMLPFRGLELQGNDNSVLFAVGSNVNDESCVKGKKSNNDEAEEDGVYIVDDWPTASSEWAETRGPSGWETLNRLVRRIQRELEGTYGFDTRWPLDEPQGDEIDYNDPTIATAVRMMRGWRPRVPFVRLPGDFYRVLEDDLENHVKSREDGEGEEGGRGPLSHVGVGLDGISPLFWYEAWGGEDILAPPGVRIRSAAVYRRTIPGGGESEMSFYVRTSSSQSWGGEGRDKWSMEFPAGDSKLAARERREKAKAMDRLGEVEQRAEREWEEGKARWIEEMNGRGPDDETGPPMDEFNVGMEIGQVTVEGDAAYSAAWDEGVDKSLRQSENEVIPKAVSSEETPSKDNKLGTDPLTTPPLAPDNPRPREDLPSIEDNPIFRRLWSGQSQVAAGDGGNTALALDGTPPTSEEPLSPYPSDAHFVGPWRVVSSPLGSQDISVGDEDLVGSKSSDNFILRVDGGVMGGPVLDAQYGHKAAGGEWRMFRAVRKLPDGGGSEGGGSEVPPATQTRLRIRLPVPPGRERAVVMEGEVTRLVMPGTGGSTSPSSEGWNVASGGMLEGMLENLKSGPMPGGNGEGLLYCSGEAWMEDTKGGCNRKKLGPFSLMKLKSIERKNLIYTVDVSRPTSDTKE